MWMFHTKKSAFLDGIHTYDNSLKSGYFAITPFSWQWQDLQPTWKPRAFHRDTIWGWWGWLSRLATPSAMIFPREVKDSLRTEQYNSSLQISMGYLVLLLPRKICTYFCKDSGFKKWILNCRAWMFHRNETILTVRDSVHKSVIVWSVHECEYLSELNSFLQPPLHEHLNLYLP